MNNFEKKMELIDNLSANIGSTIRITSKARATDTVLNVIVGELREISYAMHDEGPGYPLLTFSTGKLYRCEYNVGYTARFELHSSYGWSTLWSQGFE